MATITLKLADGSDQKIILTKEVSSVGRDSNNDVVIDDESVSTHHAEIRLVDGVHVLKDLGSTNGLRVNGERAMEARLNDGDLLRFGSVKGSYAASKAAIAAKPKPSAPEEEPEAPAPAEPSAPAQQSKGVVPAGFGGKIAVEKDPKQKALVGLGVLAILVCLAAAGMSVVM